MIFGLANIVLDGTTQQAAVIGDRVYPLIELVDDAPPTFEATLSDWDRWIQLISERLEASALRHGGVDASEVRFAPAGVGRPAIWCAGANYYDHAAEMGVKVEQPQAFHFLSPPTVLGRHGGPVVRPSGVRQLDWELELAAVIGTEARHVRSERALEYVAGYTVANDVSIRDPERTRHPFFGMDWTAAKNADGLTPLGPAIVPAAFVDDHENLELHLQVNGATMQRSSTSNMIVGLREQIAALSALVTLRPGDLVLTGTPAGTAAGHDGAYLRPGDVMTATIPGIGTLRSTVTDHT